MKNNHGIEHSEIKNIVNSGSLSLPAFIATAGTTLIIGFVPYSLLLLYVALQSQHLKELFHFILFCFLNNTPPHSDCINFYSVVP